ncbi:MAG: hypothetical protein AB7P99_09575 [Vicinamibacterales bacterium]
MARTLLACLVAAMFTSAPAAQQTFRGTITDATCAQTGHAAMRMGPTDAECTQLCVTLHRDEYVLLVEKEIYRLSDQQLPAEFAGAAVEVTGTLDAETKTIRVDAIRSSR